MTAERARSSVERSGHDINGRSTSSRSPVASVHTGRATPTIFIVMAYTLPLSFQQHIGTDVRQRPACTHYQLVPGLAALSRLCFLGLLLVGVEDHATTTVRASGVQAYDSNGMR